MALSIPDTPAGSKICCQVVLKNGTYHKTLMWYYDTVGVFHFNVLNAKGGIEYRNSGNSFYSASSSTEVLGVLLEDATWPIKLKELHDDAEVVRIL